MPDRIVVVGHSAMTCLGRDMDATWAGLVAGRSGIRRHASLDPERYLQDVAGLVEGFGPGHEAHDEAVSRLEAKFLHLGMACARQAWSDATLDREGLELDRSQVAIVFGSAFGGMDLYESEQARSARRKGLSISPYLVPGMLINQAAGQIAQHLGLHGPSVAPANACATGGHAIALGAMMIKAGEADLALCGGSESAFTPAIVNGFATMKALLGKKSGDRSLEHPEQASRPFSADRAGFVMAEGAGAVILARESVALKLGLPIQAVLLATSINSDGYHMAMPHGERIVRCLASALARSGLRAEDVDYYNAHGTSTAVNDRVETESIKTVFGVHARKLPISSIKGAIGHTLGAASAIEAAVCVRALRDQVLPPTANHIPDPELDLDYVPNESRPAKIDAAMSASFGFGGTNNALVFTRG